ncbi:MAG: segregation/condensation protein A [Phycisphaerales bacterium]
MVTATESYTVRLGVFQGPLDLLLHLIKRAELDISVISIASITDQFMASLEGIDEVDVDTAGEFLLIAATLLEIKSRSVMPAEGEGRSRQIEDDADEDSAAVQLLGQLLEYKRFRDAADALEARREQWERVFPSGKARVEKDALRGALDDEDTVDLEDVELYDLVSAFQRIMDTVVFDRLGDHEITYDDTPIELHEADIVDRIERLAPELKGRLRLRQVFEGKKKGEVIGLFLAVLELVKQRVLNVSIEDGGTEIVVSLRPESERDPAMDFAGDESDEAEVEVAATPEAWEDDHIYGDEDEPDDDDED